MNLGFDPAHIQSIKDACAKKKQSFILGEDSEYGEESANFLFVGMHNGKEVVFDAFIYTLETEFFANIFEDAKEAVIEQNPQYANEDFTLEEGKHIELMEDMADELMDDEDYKVCEFVDIDEDVEYGVAIDFCLNVPEISKDLIERIVKDFKANTLELDETFYSFVVDEDDED
jgi:hypothetical protein